MNIVDSPSLSHSQNAMAGQKRHNNGQKITGQSIMFCSVFIIQATTAVHLMNDWTFLHSAVAWNIHLDASALIGGQSCEPPALVKKWLTDRWQSLFLGRWQFFNLQWLDSSSSCSSPYLPFPPLVLHRQKVRYKLARKGARQDQVNSAKRWT